MFGTLRNLKQPGAAGHSAPCPYCGLAASGRIPGGVIIPGDLPLDTAPVVRRVRDRQHDDSTNHHIGRRALDSRRFGGRGGGRGGEQRSDGCCGSHEHIVSVLGVFGRVPRELRQSGAKRPLLDTGAPGCGEVAGGPAVPDRESESAEPRILDGHSRRAINESMHCTVRVRGCCTDRPKGPCRAPTRPFPPCPPSNRSRRMIAWTIC